MEFTAAQALTVAERAVSQYVGAITERDPDEGDHVVPGELRHFLARLRLLHGVPFSYLVRRREPAAGRVDPLLLPRPRVDRRARAGRAVASAPSAPATAPSSSRCYPHIRDEVDAAERKIRTPRDEALLQGAGGTVTGFLLRSRVVSGWPGLHVRAYSEDVVGDSELTTVAESHPKRMKVLRMERLAPAVLLVLFDGVPAVVHVEEPRQGMQFGVRIDPQAPPEPAARGVKVRVQATGAAVPPESTYTAANTVDVPFRRGAPGVVDLKRLRERLVDKPPVGAGGAMEPRDFALQMLRFPFRQVFGDPANSDAGQAFYDLDRFVVTTSVTAWTTTLRAVVQEGS